MANCEMLETCIFFNDKMKDMPKLAEIYKERYCRGNNSFCARYMVLIACGKEKVPLDLFPSQTERAKDIISKTKK